MAKVILTGTRDSYDKGDAAIRVSVAQAILSAAPNTDVLVATPHPEVDRIFYRRYGLEVCYSSRRRPLWGTFQLARAWLRGAFPRTPSLRGPFTEPEDELREFLEADLIVDLSGDMRGDGPGARFTYSHFLPILLGIALRRPVFFCAQSLGALGWTRPIARFALNRCARVTCREAITMRHLEGMRLRRAPELLADTAFLLEPAETSRVEAILKAERAPETKKRLFGASLSWLTERRYRETNPNASRLDYTHVMAEALDRVAEELDMEIILVPNVTGPDAERDDRTVTQRVRQRMRRPATALKGDYGPDELKGIIARFRFHIGARARANIAALSSGVPVVAIGHNHETPGIMEMFGLGDDVIRVEKLTVESLARKALEVAGRRGETASAIQDRLGEVRAKARQNIEIVLEAIEKGFQR